MVSDVRTASLSISLSKHSRWRDIDSTREEAGSGRLIQQNFEALIRSPTTDAALFEFLEDCLERSVHRHRRPLLFRGTELALEFARLPTA
jgi:uncharacterized protein (DUF2252 family)